MASAVINWLCAGKGPKCRLVCGDRSYTQNHFYLLNDKTCEIKAQGENQGEVQNHEGGPNKGLRETLAEYTCYVQIQGCALRRPRLWAIMSQRHDEDRPNSKSPPNVVTDVSFPRFEGWVWCILCGPTYPTNDCGLHRRVVLRKFRTRRILFRITMADDSVVRVGEENTFKCK